MDTAALVERMVDCFNRHDVHALAACYAPDAKVHPAGCPEPVDAQTWTAAFSLVLQSFPDLQVYRATWPPTTEWRSWRPA
jgi:hypothetical protein